MTRRLIVALASLAWSGALGLLACGDGERASSGASSELTSGGRSSSDPAAGDATPGDGGAPSAIPAPERLPHVTGCAAGSTAMTLTNGPIQLVYDLTAGTATFSYGGVVKVGNFYASAELSSYTTSKQYTSHACSIAMGQPVVTSTSAGLPTMTQTFLSTGGNHFLTQVTIAGSSAGTNWISPLVTDGTGTVDVGSYGDPRVLWVPYDNDAWVRYNAAPLTSSGTSFEVSAFYDNTSRNGIVVGSVTHDTWKTGVYYDGNGKTLRGMHVFGGVTDPTWTHDVVPHGVVTGGTVASPQVFVGYGADWRNLMEEYADANAAVRPKLAWDGGVPFGWDSWGVLKEDVSYDAAVATSNFIASSLEDASFNDDGVVYVNLDSYWTNLTSAELASFVATVHANHQKAGIYTTPFADWAGEASRAVPGTTGTTYGELWLRDTHGDPIQLDGAWALDPTHPGTQAQSDLTLSMFKSLGFEYVKLDFLNLGSLESTVRYDPTVQTGVQAYNQGMAHALATIGGTMFVSESIAPLFPQGYGHSRRVSCDTYGAAVGAQMSSEYELNSAGYGWWMSGRVYAYNDPDEMVFTGFSAADNVTRLLSAVVTGTVFLDGDDLSSATGQSLAATMLTHPAINEVAKLGRAFRPVEGDTGSAAPTLFVLKDAGTSYLAAFNFGSADETMAIDLARAGLDGSKTYSVTDVWTGDSSTAKGTLSVELDTDYGKLLELR